VFKYQPRWMVVPRTSPSESSRVQNRYSASTLKRSNQKICGATLDWLPSAKVFTSYAKNGTPDDVM
jgi:hypothetical protein